MVGWFRISGGDTGLVYKYIIYSNSRWVVVEKYSFRGLKVSDNVLRS